MACKNYEFTINPGVPVPREFVLCYPFDAVVNVTAGDDGSVGGLTAQDSARLVGVT